MWYHAHRKSDDIDVGLLMMHGRTIAYRRAFHPKLSKSCIELLPFGAQEVQFESGSASLISHRNAWDGTPRSVSFPGERGFDPRSRGITQVIPHGCSVPNRLQTLNDASIRCKQSVQKTSQGLNVEEEGGRARFCEEPKNSELVVGSGRLAA